MIAEYQVDKLKQRLSQQIRDIRYHSFSKIKTSSHTFKYDGKWYKLSIKVEELSLDSSKNNIIE
jgi:hemolysin activation/secretion protein